VIRVQIGPKINISLYLLGAFVPSLTTPIINQNLILAHDAISSLTFSKETHISKE
jgi:hypothetical protein